MLNRNAILSRTLSFAAITVGALACALGCSAETGDPDDGQAVEVPTEEGALLAGPMTSCGCQLNWSDGFTESYLCPFGWEQCVGESGGGFGAEGFGGGSLGGGEFASCSTCALEYHNCSQAACKCKSWTFCISNCADDWRRCIGKRQCKWPTHASCAPGDGEPPEKL